MNGFEDLCMGCMGENSDHGICPNCGFDESQALYPKYLPLRTVLQERYIVGKAVEENGEGIGYMGYDTVSESMVYIREFMPADLSFREEGQAIVKPNSLLEHLFNEYLNKFLVYSRAVARLKEFPGFIPLSNMFNEHNTAYSIYEWVESMPLSEFVKRRGGRLDWIEARPIFIPLISSLIDMQSMKVTHFGISPENLIILKDGSIKLKGFSIPEVRQVNKDIKPELFEGFSAIEQYSNDYDLNQATDVYGFTATLFFVLTGEIPQSAIKRKIDQKILIDKDIIKLIPPHIVTALANGLQVGPLKRTPTFEKLRQGISLAPPIHVTLDNLLPPSDNIKKKSKRKKRKKGISIIIISCLLALLAFLIITYIALGENKLNSLFNSSSDLNAISSEVPSSLSSIALSDPTVDLPNLVLKDFKKAEQEAENKGDYQILVSSEEFSDKVAQGLIISQTPEYTSGGKIKKGSIIAVIVSKGPNTRTLPQIAGLSLSEASKKITDAGFRPYKAQEQFSNIYSEGKVIGYSDGRNPGDLVEYDSKVGIVVSKGREMSS